MKIRSKKTSKKPGSHSLVLGLSLGIASMASATPAHTNTLPAGCSPAAAANSLQLSNDDLLQTIATLRQRTGLENLHDKILASVVGANPREMNCFGQSVGAGACGYSQEPGCAYTQKCTAAL